MNPTENIFAATYHEVFSYAVTPIELLFEKNEIAHGTGTLWRHSSKLVLVTNWHNLSGINPFTAAHLNKDGATPDAIRLYPTKRAENNDIVTFNRSPVDLPLYQHFEVPLWKQHAQFSRLRIDIAALEIGPDAPDWVTVQSCSYETIYTPVGSGVFVIGYPFRNYNFNFLPIWKSGTLASDPNVSWEGRPAFLIDAATRRGMSGSPILRRVFGPRAYFKDDGELHSNLHNVVATAFAGIYSGHLGEKEEKITIGFGWPANFIGDVLQNPASGTRG